MVASITIPHKFMPRDYQLPFLRAMDNGCKRAVCVWHRRAGKDKTFLNYQIKKMLERKGVYYYYFPTHTMGRKILWDGMDRDGMKYLDHFPKQLIKGKPNQQDMKIELRNGSIWQIIGTDRLDVVGTNPIGCVFSEYSLQNPVAWDYVRPILAENNGWGVFNFTPRGRNHGHDLYNMAKSNPEWFCELLTVDNTHAIPYEAIEEDRASGMSEAFIQQEYYCSFDYGLIGAYYAEKIAWMRENGHIGRFKHNPEKRVFLVSDLGFDGTPIIFFQIIGNTINIIDYYYNSNKPIGHYVDILDKRNADLGYQYSQYVVPHDANKREMQTNITMAESLIQKGYDVLKLEREINVNYGIERTMQMLSRVYIDEENCKELIAAMTNYRQEYNEKMKDFTGIPLHDWASHPADAMRYLSKADKEGKLNTNKSGLSVDEINNLAKKYNR